MRTMTCGQKLDSSLRIFLGIGDWLIDLSISSLPNEILRFVVGLMHQLYIILERFITAFKDLDIHQKIF